MAYRDIIVGLQEDHGAQFNFPKAELHCHLDGCFRLETIVDLAKKRKIPLPSYDVNELTSTYSISSRKKNLADYLECFDTFTPIFAGCRDSIARITSEAIEDKAKNGVKYIELRFSPQLLANCGVEPLTYCKDTPGDLTPRDVLETILKVGNQAQKEFDIEVRFILSCIVTFPEWSMEVARMCEDYADRGVVGMDVAGSGDEGGQDILKHREAFNYCKERGIHITVHAGEAGCADEVKQAMEILHAERIGHGYHVVNDEKIYAKARKENVHFEICPLSSYLTASVDPDLTCHPVVRLLKDQVNCSLNTDDPGMQQSTIFDDYKIALSNFRFSVSDIKRMNLNALRSAFCDEQLKKKLLAEFQSIYESG